MNNYIYNRIKTGETPVTKKVVIDGRLYVRDSKNKYILDSEIKNRQIQKPQDAIPWIEHMKDYEQEVVAVLVLDAQNSVISVHEISKGLVNQSLAHPREIYLEAVRRNGTSIMLVHNHPSGIATPSSSDKKTTESICSAGKILSIPLLDHLIVTKSGFSSLRELFPVLFL